MRYLITGGCGFLGSNIAAELLQRGQEVIVLDNLYRHGSHQNLEWLKTKGDFNFIHADIRNNHDVERTIKLIQPDTIYHLAGQVAMTTSIADPRLDFEVNAGGSFHLLDAVRRHCPHAAIIYSSTNKVYGDLEQYAYRETKTRYECVDKPNGFDENVPLEFHSPYGTSKGSADQYMLDFSRIYGLKTVVFRHSSMYGGRQFATYDQGWIGWFIQKALDIKKGIQSEQFTISGSGKQVRDLLYATDCVDLYLLASSKIEQIKGQAFNVGGGMENSSSLLELFTLLEDELDIKMTFTKLPPRESDQRVFVADLLKLQSYLAWSPNVTKKQGVLKTIDWVRGLSW